jgi:SpoIID/LytB domain protein
VANIADFTLVTVHRQFTTLLLAIAALFATVVGPAMAGESEVVIEGGGWGHGVGMSQFGAYGQALDGKTAEEIVAHYYAGSSTGQIPNQVGGSHFLVTDPAPLWVNILANKTVFQFEARNGSLTACHSGTGCNDTVTPGETWKFVALGNGTCRFEADGRAVTDAGDCRATVKGMSPEGAQIRISGLRTTRDEFARGVMRVRSPNGGASFHVSLEIGLEDYMYGLAEVPFSWHVEALRAQALAGRSYATWRLISRGRAGDFPAERRAACWCHIYATTADQSYRGWTNETAAAFENWRGAVDSTAGTVITHPDASQANVVAAFYSSSTGGRTENINDIWGGNPVSYLRAQADPWSQYPQVNNPFGYWAFPFTEDELAAQLDVDEIDGIKIAARFDSGTPSVVKFYTRRNGAETTIVKSGAELYTMLGLRGRHIAGFDYGPIPSVGGDFTGDGRADIAMPIGFNNTWWVGTSVPGKFVMDAWFNHPINSPLRFPVAGDFNGDNRQDVAALQMDTGELLVGLSSGTGFDFTTWAEHGDPQAQGPLLVGDFTGDGIDDLAEDDATAERWTVYRLAGTRVVRATFYDFSVVDPNWGAHVVGDYNGDGKDDILSWDAATGDLIVLFSDGSAMVPSPWQTLPDAEIWENLQAADFTGSGRDDLAAYDPVAGTWWVVAGRKGTSGAAPAAWFTFVDPDQGLGAQIAGDFNNDGRADIVAYRTTNGRLKLLRSDGTRFTRKSWGTIAAREQIATMFAIDANGDGKLDIAAWDNTERVWRVARNKAPRFRVSRWGRLLK